MSRAAILVLAAAALVAHGCKRKVCEPISKRACPCPPPHDEGWQVCDYHGTRWSACICGPDDGQLARAEETEPAAEPEASDADEEAVQEPAASGSDAPSRSCRGRLSKWDIRETLSRHATSIRSCYGSAEGNVTVRLLIGADGDVESARIRKSTLGNAEVESCMLQQLERITFPPPEGGDCVLDYPFAVGPG